jgi:undecaprenyl-diphosphatase
VNSQLENPAIKAAIWICTSILVLLIALSRVYIGIHYPTDVVAGLAAAAIWTASVLSTDRRPAH